MAEEKILNTKTSVNISGTNINIRAYYDAGGNNLNTLAALISDIVQTIDGVQIIEGELAFQLQNYPSQIDYTLDSNGDLVVSSEDASKYSIDSLGNLIYTE